MDCVICMQTTDEIYKVTCGSSVPHLMCFECEGEWRAKMPLQDGLKLMTCPTCRQPERERTMESMKREIHRLQQEVAQLKQGQRVRLISRHGNELVNWIRPTL